MHHTDVYVGISHQRVAVKVNESRRSSVHVNVACLEGLHLGVHVYSLVEQLKSHLRCLDNVEGFDDNNVEQAVAHGGLWGDEHVVAIL